MLSRFFFRKNENLRAPGIEKIDGFIQYLKDRHIAPTAISRFTRVPGRKQLAASDTLFNNSKYFIIPDSGNKHPELVNHFAESGLRFFEGQLGHAPSSHSFLIGEAILITDRQSLPL